MVASLTVERFHLLMVSLTDHQGTDTGSFCKSSGKTVWGECAVVDLDVCVSETHRRW